MLSELFTVANINVNGICELESLNCISTFVNVTEVILKQGSVLERVILKQDFEG